ncbi:hypothetical protein [Nocardia brasiliensis]|uniref:hypothetical protein n=1 Tax=Nocardia brasiliensis TaxID=37326 RepID=UPI00366DF0CA
MRTTLITAMDAVMVAVHQPIPAACLVVVIVAVIALMRARPEDIPQIFASFTTAFGLRRRPPQPHERPEGISGAREATRDRGSREGTDRDDDESEEAR